MMMVVRVALCALALDAAAGATAGALMLAAVGAGARASQCTGSSAGLAEAECDAWVDFYDAIGGKNWFYCSDSRLDPCACESSWTGVTCSGSHITRM